MNILRNSRTSPTLRQLISLARNSSSSTLEQAKFIVEPLKQRQIVRVKGEDVISFLQGLTTNDMRQLQTSSSIYTMFLNKAGRVLYDAIMYMPPKESSTVLLECDKDICNELMRHLKLYRVRRKIQIDNVADEFNIWSAFNILGEPSINSNSSTIEKLNNVDGIDVTQDPRLQILGHRIVCTSDKSWTDLSKVYENTIVVEPPSDTNNFQLHRYKIGVAEGVHDMPPGKQFPLEANCDLLNGVSFNKGCYIGQELTARVHHTGVIRKRHMPVLLSVPLAADSSKAMLNESEAKLGNILGSVGNQALGLLRIEQVMKSKELSVDGKPCHVEKPKWWPTSLLTNVSSKEEV
ncbi:putative transferase CAF17 homolog, mitochondrial [Stomoxys calcitrans]|uniref:Uncharacterized protein n=1 Tax=Stomoxys calcitrans TaxID=35570 RepID=A0A1I8NSV2_STOCA|nr:putative transferase CAF17 homolog, mitochondrial [Stomoxys calcitrans]